MPRVQIQIPKRQERMKAVDTLLRCLGGSQTTSSSSFVVAPLDFDKAYAAAMRMEVAPNLLATFVSSQDLLLLKQRAGRAKDLLDIENLQTLRGEAGNG
jgi:hypothetical protein